MEYLVVKWLHVLSSTILFGTGIGSAYYLLCASLRRDVRTVHAVVRWVVIADWLFTTPAVVIQPATGWYLAHLAGLSLWTPWIAWSIGLFLLAGACWVPVLWMQIRMRDMARTAMIEGALLSDRYWFCFRLWMILGAVAFTSLVVVFYLMVAKPA